MGDMISKVGAAGREYGWATFTAGFVYGVTNDIGYGGTATQAVGPARDRHDREDKRIPDLPRRPLAEVYPDAELQPRQHPEHGDIRRGRPRAPATRHGRTSGPSSARTSSRLPSRAMASERCSTRHTSPTFPALSPTSRLRVTGREYRDDNLFGRSEHDLGHHRGRVRHGPEPDGSEGG